MNLAEKLKQEFTVKNTKNGNYYLTSYNSNLDFFAKTARFDSFEQIQNDFSCALIENKELALANLLFALDIRGGKGERDIFKAAFNYLCKNDIESAAKILPFIGKLGRYDYILEGLNTPFEENVISFIATQLEEDLKSEHPSLLAKWLPSHRNGKKDSKKAKRIMCKMGINERQYRKMLSSLRLKINLVETNLTNKEYDQIDYEQVPTKAMLKYKNTFNKVDKENFGSYLESIKKGEKKINTSGLFAHEVIREINKHGSKDKELLDAMWNNQKDLLKGINKNVLVVADTSGSMLWYENGLPLDASIGLAIYTAERNTGLFQNMFITFSSNPTLQEVKGDTIYEKVKNIHQINSNTDIDKVFEMLLNTMKRHNGVQDDLPSHIIIISDMEFDEGIKSRRKTNFQVWKGVYEEYGYTLPKIVFWNVAGKGRGLPATKYDNDVIMVSGFSTNLLENIFNVEEYKPETFMLTTLQKYVDMLK